MAKIWDWISRRPMRCWPGASAITLDMGGTDGQVTLRELRAQAQNLTMDVSGQLAQAGLDLSGRLDFPDLSVLGAQYGGRVMADLAGLCRPVEQAAVNAKRRRKMSFALGPSRIP